MNKNWKVYVHINKYNDKRYVGITSKDNVEHRWNHGRGYKQNPHFYSAICKYGWDGFKHFVIISGIDEQLAKEIEVFLIKNWHTRDTNLGYNMTDGGDGTKGYIPTAETRKKLSDARRKENLSEETLRRRSEGLKGRIFSEAHKQKIGKGNSKPIEMLDTDCNVLKKFNSAHEAEISTGVSHAHISQCCHNKRNTAGGYRWRFVQ